MQDVIHTNSVMRTRSSYVDDWLKIFDRSDFIGCGVDDALDMMDKFDPIQLISDYCFEYRCNGSKEVRPGLGVQAFCSKVCKSYSIELKKMSHYLSNYDKVAKCLLSGKLPISLNTYKDDRLPTQISKIFTITN